MGRSEDGSSNRKRDRMSFTLEYYDTDSASWVELDRAQLQMIERPNGRGRLGPEMRFYSDRTCPVEANDRVRVKNSDSNIIFLGRSKSDGKFRSDGYQYFKCRNDIYQDINKEISMNRVSTDSLTILGAAISKTDLSADFTGATSYDIDKYDVENRKIKKIFQDMVSRCGYVYRVEQDTVYIEDENARGTIFEVETGTSPVKITEYEEGNIDTVINKVTVRGSSQNDPFLYASIEYNDGSWGITKINSDGSLVWQKEYDVSSIWYDIVSNQEDYIWTGNEDENVFKFDDEFKEIWKTSTKGTNDDLRSVDIDATENVYVADTGGTVEKIEDDGTHLWELDTGNLSNILKVRADKNGNVYAAQSDRITKISGAGTELTAFTSMTGIRDMDILDTDNKKRVYYVRDEGSDGEWGYLESDLTSRGDYVLSSDREMGSIAVGENAYYIGYGGNVNRISKRNLDDAIDEIWRFYNHNEKPTDIELDSQGYIYSASDSTEVKRIEPTNGNEIWTFSHPSKSLNSILSIEPTPRPEIVSKVVEATASDSTSISKYGQRAKTYDLEYVDSESEALNMAQARLRPEPLPGAEMELTGSLIRDDDIVNHQIGVTDTSKGIETNTSLTVDAQIVRPGYTKVKLGGWKTFGPDEQRNDNFSLEDKTIPTSGSITASSVSIDVPRQTWGWVLDDGNKPSNNADVTSRNNQPLSWLSSIDTDLDMSNYVIKNIKYLIGNSLSSDPPDPSTNKYVLWQSDGGGSGDDGDIMIKITDSGGSTKTTTVIDYSSI